MIDKSLVFGVVDILSVVYFSPSEAIWIKLKGYYLCSIMVYQLIIDEFFESGKTIVIILFEILVFDR